VFNRLPEWMREGRANPAVSKKRRQESDLQPPAQAASHADISVTAQDQAPQLQQRANTFPHQNQKNRSALPRVETRPYDPSMSSTLQSMSNNPQNIPYTPGSASYTQQSFNPSDTSPMNAGMNFGLPPNQNNPNLPDLSAMMFPSAEPFTYPNQPLTTFENNQFTKQPQYFNNMNDASGMMGSRIPQPESDNMEAQLYALPPYMMQGNQWPVGIPNQQSRPPPPGSMPGSSQQGMQPGPVPSNANWNNPQAQAFADINLNDIFGGAEWNSSLMDQNYG